MRWLEMVLVAFAVDVALLSAGFFAARRAMRRMMPPGLMGAAVRPRKVPVASP